MPETNFRALCAALVDEAPYESPTTCLARAALAQPEPEGLTDAVSELVSQCRPLDPEMAECLTPNARWRLYGTDAQPEPVGLSDEELMKLACAANLTYDSGNGCFASPYWEETDIKEEVQTFARAVLTRWGRPAIQPIPVAEHPWEREGWCDAEGKCWFGAPQDGPADAGWILRMPSERLSHQTASLPHYALPIPTSQEDYKG